MNIGVIPARLKSDRFPRKILALIQDKPMVVHVYERASKAKLLDDVIVAIDSEETEEALKPFNINTVMTHPEHKSGTDRMAEVVEKMNGNIVVNIQGDEPKMEPELIDKLIHKFHNSDVLMATAASTDITSKDILDLNTVKVLVNQHHIAKAFRREPRQYEIGGYYRHIGIYAFRKPVLMKYTTLPQSENEKTHRLEQLRALDNGLPIHVIMTNYSGKGIDTKEDLKAYLETHG